MKKKDNTVSVGEKDPISLKNIVVFVFSFSREPLNGKAIRFEAKREQNVRKIHFPSSILFHPYLYLFIP